MIYAYSFLTLITFLLGLKISQKLRITILNPFLVAITILITILVVFDIPHSEYYKGNFPINNLLGVSVVALALPFYEQLPQIRKRWREISIIILFATGVTLLTGVLFALLFGASKEVMAVVLPKSVSTPIAIAISNEINGNSAIAVVGVMIAGMFGSIFGISILRLVGVRNLQAIGLSMGAVSHALGTGRSMEYNIKAGSYSSTALVACGAFSSILAPLLFRIIVVLFY